MRSKKQVIVAGQRPSDRSALVLFLAKKTDTRAGQKLESGLDVLLREAEISAGGLGISGCSPSQVTDAIKNKPFKRNQTKYNNAS